MEERIADKNQPTRTTMVRLVFWSVWFSSGLMVLLLLGAIVVTLYGEASFSNIQQNIDSIDSDNNLHGIKVKKEVDVEVQEIIKQIYNRKGHSNPTPIPDDDEVVTRKQRRKRPLRLIDKNFDPNKSFVVRHPNGTLTYVFPNDLASSTTSTTSTPPLEQEDKVETDNLIDRKSTPSEDPFRIDSAIDYPTDFINEIMNSHKASFEGAFGDDTVIPAGDSLYSRSHTSSDEFLCDSEEKLIHPRSGSTRNNSTVWIVNTEDFKQGVRIETCRNAGKPCNFCAGEETACKQVFHYRTLVAVNKKSGGVTKEQILLPSCCKCARVT